MSLTETLNIDELNRLNETQATEALTKCCGSHRWVQAMLAERPFSDAETVLEAAERIWNELEESDWKEAFTHHPKIGDLSTLREKFANTGTWAKNEQQGVNQASEAVLQALSDGNRDYENRFGYIFIVCATGKSAEEMLALLQSRLTNQPENELAIAAGEQLKITLLRLNKLSVQPE